MISALARLLSLLPQFFPPYFTLNYFKALLAPSAKPSKWPPGEWS